MSSIRPNRDQFLALLEAPDEGPVVMLNLLKFKPRSSDGASTGGEEYKKYSQTMLKNYVSNSSWMKWYALRRWLRLLPTRELPP